MARLCRMSHECAVNYEVPAACGASLLMKKPLGNMFIHKRSAAFGVALLICFAVDLVGDVLELLLPLGWRAGVREVVLRVGAPESFVTGRLSFALLRLPEWALLGLVIGLVRGLGGRLGERIGWYAAWAYPVVDIGSYISIASVVGLQVSYGHHFWLGTVLAAAMGTPWGLLAWWLAGKVAGSRAVGGGPEVRERS